MLVRLIYTSISSSTMQPDDMQSLLIAARKNNARDDITGILCYGNNRFIQYVEGERPAINRLYEKLVQDSRHNKLVILSYEDIRSRMFDNWSMGFVNLKYPTLQKIVYSHARAELFEPENFTSVQAAKIMKAFKKHLPYQFSTAPAIS